jgi:orotate phosphoribosyltransferase
MSQGREACDREGLLERLKESGAVAFGEFTLASGKTSDFYVNIKKAYTDPGTLAGITSCFSDRLANEGVDTDRLAGVELGAVPLLVALSLELGRPFVIVRKDPKGHGLRELFIGDVPQGSRFVMVEDVLTTAGSVVKAVGSLREAGAKVEHVLAVVDRREGSVEALEGAGLRSLAIFTSDEVRSG